MKYLALLAVLSLPLLSSCGGDSGSGACKGDPIVGSWTVSGQPLIFTESCTFSSATCGSSGTFTPNTATTGTTTATVTAVAANAPAGCLAKGTYTCTYAVSGSSLSYVCQ